LKQSRGSSREGGSTEFVNIRTTYSRCARRVTGCSWSCGRFCWKIPGGWTWRAPWHHHNSTLPGHHHPSSHPPLPYPWPLPWTRLSSMLRPVHLQAWQMRNCAGDFCSHPLEHCTVGLVQCSKAPCCTLSNVPKALPLEGVCVHVCVSYSSLAQVA